MPLTALRNKAYNRLDLNSLILRTVNRLAGVWGEPNRRALRRVPGVPHCHAHGTAACAPSGSPWCPTLTITARRSAT